MRRRNALVLCTGNSARSILGEALIAHHGGPHWCAFSAGSRPTGRVNPLAIATLTRHGIALPDIRSKSWDEFSRPDAPVMDLVVTVCDSAAQEPCPVWLGTPFRAHWGLPDPASAQGEAELVAAFESAYQTLRSRVVALMNVDFNAHSAEAVQHELTRIASVRA